MGNKIDKLDPTLLLYAPLDEEIISNLYFIHDAFRYMDLISLACEGIIRPSQTESKGRISTLEDLGVILKSSGKKLGGQSTFSKILLAVGNLEILLGKMENVWAYEIENLIVKPIQKCLCEDSDELTIKRDQIMRFRINLKDAKMSHSKDVENLEKEYQKQQSELKIRLIEEKKTISEFWRNLTKVLASQLEMVQNSAIHLEALVETLQKNPRKVHVSEEDMKDDSFSFKEMIKINSVAQSSVDTEAASKVDLPEFSKLTAKNKNIFSRFISRTILSNTISKKSSNIN